MKTLFLECTTPHCLNYEFFRFIWNFFFAPNHAYSLVSSFSNFCSYFFYQIKNSSLTIFFWTFYLQGFYHICWLIGKKIQKARHPTVWITSFTDFFGTFFWFGPCFSWISSFKKLFKKNSLRVWSNFLTHCEYFFIRHSPHLRGWRVLQIYWNAFFQTKPIHKLKVLPFSLNIFIWTMLVCGFWVSWNILKTFPSD